MPPANNRRIPTAEVIRLSEKSEMTVQVRAPAADAYRTEGR
jgi:hypothetical protein